MNNEINISRLEMEPVKIQYSGQQIQKAVRSYWWTRKGSQYLLLLIPATIIIIYRIVTDNFTWSAGILSFISIYVFILMTITYIHHIGQVSSQLRSVKGSNTTLELCEKQFRIVSEGGATEIPWDSIIDVWRSDKVWLFVFSNHNIFSLPTAGFSQELETFIISKIKSILFQTNQVWKVYVSMLCCCFAYVFISIPIFIDFLSDQWPLFSYMLGFVFAIGALIFLLNIRCPKCRSRWHSKPPGMKASGYWPYWLLELGKCPFCGASKFDNQE
ncbi:MAG: YcxB family protein [Gammaproteobacteria bacterium]|nr:YcxB family protein [Gammaproteobacteria bacterium]